MSNPINLSEIDPWIVYAGQANEAQGAIWNQPGSACGLRSVSLYVALAELAQCAPAGLHLPLAVLADVSRDRASVLVRLPRRARAGYFARELRRLCYAPLSDGGTQPNAADFRRRLLSVARALESLPLPSADVLS